MQLRLSVLPFELAVARLASDTNLSTIPGGSFASVTRTDEELSIVCEPAHVPAGAKVETGWRAVKIAGPIPFEMTGVAAAVVAPLAAAKISVFPLATFDTDYILVRSIDLEQAVAVLRRAGHEIGQ